MRRAVWWLAFTILAVWAQSRFPGVDFLIPGLILSLQEDPIAVPVWLGLLWIFLQEGMGSLPFGHALLWYGMASAMFLGGRWLFEAKNLLFMSLLGLALGVLHYGLILVMAALHDWNVSYQRIMTDSVYQAIVFPFEWALLHILYRSIVPSNVKPV